MMSPAAVSTDVKTLDDRLNQAILTGRAMDVFEELYAENVIMQENSEPPIVGKATNRQREIEFFNSIAEWHKGALLGVAVDGNRSYSEWELDVTFKNGHRAHFT